MSSQFAATRTLDNVSQPGHPAPYSHPERLASVAILYGMRPRRVDRCRVLELGCAGGNLLPMADRHPQSTFVGIDGAARQIAAARQAATTFGLENLELHEMNIEDVGDELGAFDYILCHDRLSRVGPDAQHKILAICRSRLDTHGLAYIGYRTLPGRIVAGTVRAMIHGLTLEIEPIRERVVQARKTLAIAQAALDDDDSAFGRMLRGETELALSLDDASLVHEHLGTEDHPLYFHEFAERVARHELQYLGDADVATMFPAAFVPAVESNLAQVARDPISLAQYMDLLSNRSFRSSVLCRREVSFSRRLSAASLHGLFLAANPRRETAAGESRSEETARFVTGKGTVISTTLPAVKVALDELARRWPRSVPFGEMMEIIETTLTSAGAGQSALTTHENDQLAQNLVDGVINGLIEVRSEPDGFTSVVSERPRASRFMRAQAQALPYVTNRRHEPVALDEMSRNLLGYLDGEHNRAALFDLLVGATNQGQLSILRSGIPASQGESVGQILEQVLDQSLARLAASALLVA